MPWPIPNAKTIAASFATNLEAGLAKVAALRGLLVDPNKLSLAVRSSRGVFAQIGRAVALEVREVHDHVAYWARQYFVDTAEEEMVQRHASIWGLEPRPAAKAVGLVRIQGTIGGAVPIDLELSAAGGLIYTTTETATIVDGGVVVAVIAASAGSASNLDGGIRLSTVAAFPDISRIDVEPDGIVGGTNDETWPELQARVIDRIRERPHGGAAFDYPTWLGDNFAVKAVSVAEDWIGRGSVGVVVAMRNDDGTARIPGSEEIDAMRAHLGVPNSRTGVRPVTARTIVVPCVFEELALTVRLRPDTVATRAAVTEAWQRFVETIGDEEDDDNDGPIGATIEPSRISEAISAASGEYAHDLVLPADAFTLAATEYPVAGEPTFLSA